MKYILWTAFFAAGFGVGVLVAKAKYENQVKTGVGGVLSDVGLGGGAVESTVDKLLGVG